MSMNEYNQPDVPIPTGMAARLTVEQVAKMLGFSIEQIRYLTAKRMIKPLGKPVQQSTKYYATLDVLRLQLDLVWLSKATTHCQTLSSLKLNGKAKH